jgi:TetR/AcrR family transcriptional regulator
MAEAGETREKILETAIRLFSTQGYATTSLSQVAKEAAVSKALIFWHFENKETLFRTVVQRALEPYFINVLDDLEGLAEPDQLVRLIEEYFDFVSENLASVRFLLGLVVREDQGAPEDVVGHMHELSGVYQKLLADVIESGRQGGTIREDVDAEVEAQLLMGALHGVVVQRFLGGPGTGGRPLLAHLCRRLIDTLRRSPAP